MLFSLLVVSEALAQADCSSNQFDEVASVRYVHDGDTLHLADGRKIRLIGINAPELERDQSPAQPFANEAKRALTALFIKDRTISLVYGEDETDRYGRLLAHVFLADGQNVQALLLNQGYAQSITIPPNTKFSSCYAGMEHIARCNHNGLWKQRNILDAKHLSSRDTGFHLVRGRLEQIVTDNKGTWLTIDDKLTVGIRPADWSAFDLKKLKAMLNQTVIVRGWINASNRSTPYYLRLRHPLSLQLFSAFQCADDH